MTAAVAPFSLTVSAHAPVFLQGGVPAGLVRIACWSWAIGYLGDVDTMPVIPKWPIAWGGTASSMLTVGTPLKLFSILRSQALINDSYLIIGGAIDVISITLSPALSSYRLQVGIFLSGRLCVEC